MPTLTTFLQVAAGAGGTGVVLGLWLFITWRENRDLKAEIKVLNAKIEARDALRLADHQGPLRNVAEALFAASDDERAATPAEPPPRRPTGGHRRQT